MKYGMPKDKKSFQMFLGFVNYLRGFIPNLSEITGLLRSVEFKWESGLHDICINEIKQRLASPPVSGSFDEKLQIVVQTDLSKNAIAIVMLQKGQPVVYASKSLSKPECEYGQIDKEFLAIFTACKKFNYYIYGRHTIIHTHHQPLVALMRKD
ncbi:hypothetical protein PR048_004940 [Dryococelus australis]|uniref:Reverse transcriptase/retrotransposon-derived protein RNase H-like domain-containing protein n=1 Tax=Dryococelus australis TaxID=614101 RepID=A0ABQ9I7X7_9NEOP|nr:hypothetical protein PR048_004940 [Dryococelus australis]